MKRPSTERAREVGALREKLLVAEEASRNACADTASTRAEFDAADAYRFFVMKAVGFWVFKAVLLDPITRPHTPSTRINLGAVVDLTGPPPCVAPSR